jgi:D-alanyl-D-alanine carboxypeptidase
MTPLLFLLLMLPTHFSPPQLVVNDFDVFALKEHHAQTIQHQMRHHYLLHHKNPFHEEYQPSSKIVKIHEHFDDITIIVNRFLTLPSTYEPSDLVDLSTLDQTHPSSLLREEAAHAFIALRQAVKRDLNVNIVSRSAYRSYEEQTRLFNRYAAQDGVLKANRYSAFPGQSEHQTGLAVDIAQSDQSYLKFKSSLAYPYLKTHAYRYGFTLRYPEGKSKITGYIYEPWHWRYVGLELATRLFYEELTLDEFYLNSLK